ncbi:MAG: anti-sigma F factor [Lachnospiraceae bacterium]|nr:anti-sigma F factor [Lachnospiraceae bacterium]
MEQSEGREKMTLILESRSSNEKLARVTAAAFFSRLDPTLEEVEDVKTAVSEAVTNCIIHGYGGGPGEIYLEAELCDRELTLRIRDQGIGIENVARAREPLFTTRPDEGRSGMGFSFMEAFMDRVDVVSRPGEGTVVTMKKRSRERQDGMG